METHIDPIKALLQWQADGQAAALAVVVETWGSAPRPVGSLLAISEEAALVGSVSGGCVEGAVVAEALELMGGGAPRMLEFGVSDEEAFAVGLACGGQIKVLVVPAGPLAATLKEVGTARAEMRPVAHVIEMETGQARIAGPAEYPERFRTDKSGVEPEGFVIIHNPPLRLAVIGGVHIAQVLVPMARMAGYACTVIDPRAAFASEARFPKTPLSHDWPDAALAAFEIDARTAVATLTHDPKIDDPALQIALQSDAFYIGALGSTRTHAKRVARLREAGLSEANIARLHAPIGLDIGAKTPAEIAVSILAQMTESLRQR